MIEPPELQNLLRIIRSSFKTGCKTMSCSCRKHGLKCNGSCKECRGVSCITCQEVDLDVFNKHD